MRPASLRAVLFSWFLWALLVVWVIGSLAAIATIDRLTQAHYDEELLDTAMSIDVFVRADENRLSIRLSETEQRSLLFDAVDEEVFAVTADDGRVIAGEPDLPMPAGPFPLTPHYYDAEYRGQPMRWLATTTRRAAPTPGAPPLTARMVVGETRRKRETATRQGVIYVVTPQLVSAVLLAVLVWFGITRGLRPMRELRRRLNERSAVDLSPLNVDRAPEEIEIVTQALNRLLGRLASAIEQQSTFIGDAAHQLRTPLAALKVSVEYARRHAATGEARRHLDSVIDTSDRCIRVVNQLLALARADAAHTGRIELEDVDVERLGEDIVAESAAAAALSRNIDVGLERRASRAVVQAEPTLLREAIRNLVDNAIQHAADGGRVTVTIDADAERLTVSVVDDGPGVPEAERERIFERFHRGEAAAGSGSGLGLPIARLCARAMGGDVVYFDPPFGVGAGFAIRMPASR